MGLFDFYSCKPVVKFTNKSGEKLRICSLTSSMTLMPSEVYETNGECLYTFDTGVSFEIPDGYFGVIIEDEDLHKRGFNLANNVMILTGKSDRSLKITLAQIDNDAAIIGKDTPIAKIMILPVMFCDFVEQK